MKNLRTIEERSNMKQQVLDEAMLMVMWAVYAGAFLASLYVTF